MAGWVRVLAVQEDPNSVPGIQIGQLMDALTIAPRDQMPSSGLCRYLHVVYTHIYKKFKSLFIFVLDIWPVYILHVFAW